MKSLLPGDVTLVLCHGQDLGDRQETFAPEGVEVGFYGYFGENVPMVTVLAAISSGAPPIDFVEAMLNYELSPLRNDDLAAVLQTLPDAHTERIYVVPEKMRLCSTPDACARHAREGGRRLHDPGCTGLFSLLPGPRIWLAHCRGTDGDARMTTTYSEEALTRTRKHYRALVRKYSVNGGNQQLESFLALPSSMQAMLLQDRAVEANVEALVAARERFARGLARDDDRREMTVKMEDHPTSVWFDAVVKWASARSPHRTRQARALAAVDAAWQEYLETRARSRTVAPHEVQTVCEVHAAQLDRDFLERFSARLHWLCAFADLRDLLALRSRGEERAWQQVLAAEDHPLRSAAEQVGALDPAQPAGVSAVRLRKKYLEHRSLADVVLRKEIRRWYEEVQSEGDAK